MRFRECMSKNEGVAGYVEAFWHVLSESQTAHMYQLLIIQCTSSGINAFYLYNSHSPKSSAICDQPNDHTFIRIFISTGRLHIDEKTTVRALSAQTVDSYTLYFTWCSTYQMRLIVFDSSLSSSAPSVI